ncbi:TetR/AcrR family transcriptional regulator [Pararhodobacter zhoushanensis]|uniref:TetR/AcrR family transcriptional regulator n=1 Tax=Pararhodobacter zhoushanensis TaxID=2479545 RepID=UPI000F8EC07D|nr:TetR/AcrR family transcriptional regulator [Pararhodobacter zhoushanensis]
MTRRAKATAAPSPWSSQSERERERAAKREAVLRTAARLFNTRGYHATSLDEVATALNVTKPTIYHYFANKDEILFECTRRGLDAIIEASRRTAAQGGSAAERLRGVLTVYALTMMDDFGICVARTQDHLLSEPSRQQFRALKREIDALIRHLVVEGGVDGSVQVRDVRIATFTAAQALNGLGNWFNPEGPMTAPEVADQVVQTLMAGLTGRGAATD